MKALWFTIKEIFKVGVLFSAFSLLFYFSLHWLNEEYQNYQKYEKPDDSAVKVFQVIDEGDEFLTRLIYFFQNGE